MKKNKTPDKGLDKNIDATANNNPVVAKPDFLPDKFWDEIAGTARLKELAKSYSELEKQQGRWQKQHQDLVGWQTEKQTLQDDLKSAQEKLSEAEVFAYHWSEEKDNLIRWARNMFGQEAAQHLINQEQGMKALHHLKQGWREPSLMMSVPSIGRAMNETELRRLMKSPSYWRDKKPDVLKKVETGFNKLYGKNR